MFGFLCTAEAYQQGPSSSQVMDEVFLICLCAEGVRLSPHSLRWRGVSGCLFCLVPRKCPTMLSARNAQIVPPTILIEALGWLDGSTERCSGEHGL